MRPTVLTNSRNRHIKHFGAGAQLRRPPKTNHTQKGTIIGKQKTRAHADQSRTARAFVRAGRESGGGSKSASELSKRRPTEWLEMGAGEPGGSPIAWARALTAV